MSAFYSDNDRVGGARGRSSANCHCASPRSVRLLIAFEHHFRACKMHSSSIFNSLNISIVALLAAVLQSGPSVTAGALAVGLPADVAHQGFAAGHALNAPDLKTARKRAIDGCHKSTGASTQAKDLCKVIATFSNQCYAIALDPKDGTPGVGPISEMGQKRPRIALSLAQNPPKVLCLHSEPDTTLGAMA
jgi:hypothetical protein